MRFRKVATVGVGCLVLLAAGVGSAVAIDGPKVTCTSGYQAWYPDFDGKANKADVPVGVPGDRGGAGSIEIRYDTANAKSLQAPDAKAGDRFGAAFKVADVNQDNCSDLLVGAPGRDSAGVADSGSIYVFLGSDNGLVHSKTLEMGAGGMPGPAQKGAGFGSVIASGPNDGFIAGLPKYDVDGQADAGAFIEFDLEQGQLFHQSSPGAPGAVEAGDNLGAAVSGAPASDFKQAATIGAPNEDIGAVKDAGVVLVAGWDGETRRWDSFSQDDPGVPGTSEAGDQFGAALLGGHIGVPGEDIGGVTDAGAIVVDWAVWGGPMVRVSQDTPGIPGAAESGDRFGAALDHRHSIPMQEADEGIAVGVPGEDIGNVKDAGVINEIGVSGNDTVKISDGGTVSANSAGGQATAGANFGASVRYYMDDPDDYRSYYVIGAPGTSGAKGQAFYGDLDERFHPWTDVGTPEAGDAYGRSL